MGVGGCNLIPEWKKKMHTQTKRQSKHHPLFQSTPDGDSVAGGTEWQELLHMHRAGAAGYGADRLWSGNWI